MGKSADLWKTRMQRFSKDAVEDQDLHVLCNINIYGRQISKYHWIPLRSSYLKLSRQRIYTIKKGTYPNELITILWKKINEYI